MPTLATQRVMQVATRSLQTARKRGKHNESMSSQFEFPYVTRWDTWPTQRPHLHRGRFEAAEGLLDLSALGCHTVAVNENPAILHFISP